MKLTNEKEIDLIVNYRRQQEKKNLDVKKIGYGNV